MTDDKDFIEIDIPPKEEKNKLPPDYAQEREALLLSWRELLEPNSLGEQIKQLFEICTALPNPSVQIPFLVGFSMLPTAIVNIAPIGIAQGQSGTGKSDLGVIISSLYDAPVLPANTTYAGLRNHIKFYKFYDAETCQYEKHFCVVFDDIGASTISANEALFTLLKTGCNRKTSLTKIALPKGEVLEFNTFCTKFLTSIIPFWEELELLELKRRSLIFKTAKSENLTIVDPKEINFNGLSQELDFYWRNPEARDIYRKRLIGFGKHPHRETMATVSTVLNLPKQEVLELYGEFEAMASVEIANPLTEFITQQIKDKNLAKIYTQNIRLLATEAKEKGIVDRCSVKEFSDTLKALGWKMKTNGNSWYFTKEN